MHRLKHGLFILLGTAIVTLILSATHPSWWNQAAFASGTTYYVSPTGSDTNAGTIGAPFQTFSKAVSVLQPGDTLNVFGGTYTSNLSISRSGVAGSPITVQAVAGQQPVIDLGNANSPNVYVTGSYITVSGLEAKNSNGYCVDLEGSNNTLKNMLVHDCSAMGIYTDGSNELIDHNTVYHASEVDSGFTMSGGWGSGIKVHYPGTHITISNNTVYNNYGEGIAVTRGTYSTVVNNIAHDNYSVNIYIDNSYDVLVDKNFVYNLPNNGFLRNGWPADGIGIGEEAYTQPDGSSWGAQLHDVTVVNNIVNYGSHGITFYGNDSGAANGGLVNSTIAFNTFYNSYNTEINIAYDTAQANDVIADNVVSQPSNKLLILANTMGINVNHNYWVNGSVQGAGDVVGSSPFASTPSCTAVPCSNGLYGLIANSTAIGAGTAITSGYGIPSTGIIDDFFGNGRGSSYDIGAVQFNTTSAPVSPSPVSSPTSVPTSIPSPSIVPTLPPTSQPTPTPVPSPTPVSSPTTAPAPSPTPTPVASQEQVSITSPQNGITATGKNLPVTVTGSDTVKIVKVQVYVDGSLRTSALESTTKLSYVTSVGIKNLGTGAHTLSAAVTDSLGTRVSQFVTFYK